MPDATTMAALEKVLETYKTGGEFQQQRTSQLGAAEKKYTTGAQAQLAGRGLAGTTIAASIPGAFEQEVGAPFRTETERLRSAQEMNALLAKAGFMESESERQLKLQMQQSDLDAQAKALADQIAAGKYDSSMSAASRVAAAKYGAGGSGGGGGGAGGGGAFINSQTGSDMWARRTGDGGGDFSTGGAAQHIGSGGGFSSGGAGGSWGGANGGTGYSVNAAGEIQSSGGNMTFEQAAAKANSMTRQYQPGGWSNPENVALREKYGLNLDQ